MFSPISFHLFKYRMIFLLLAGISTTGYALTFDEAMRLAQAQAPQIKAREGNLAAAQSSLQPAGALPDPQLALGIENLPIEGPDRYSLSSEPMTMRRIGVMQEFPNSSKLQARESAAQGRIALEETRLLITRLAVARETAMAWIARATIEQQLARIDDLRAENRLLDSAVKAMLSGGKGSATDAVTPRQEAAMIEDRADELSARRAQAIAALRRWVGVAADEKIQGSAPEWPVASEVLVHGVHQHPELAEFDAKAQVMDAEISEANADKTSDWSLELDYQKRGDQFGDMASVQARFSLPVFSGSRQDPRIAAKRAERTGLDAEREITLREHAAMTESDLAEYQRLVNIEGRQREVLLPLAAEKISLAMGVWRGGKGSLAEVISARRERIDIELKIIELEGQRLQIAARLHYVNSEHGAQP
jgi:outer membrane protein, heavy metal efflux system